MIYIVIFFILLIFTYRYDYIGNKEGRLKAYYFVLFLLIMVAGFRYRLGLDTIRYERGFHWMPTLAELKWVNFIDNNFDPLYLLLSSFAKSISSEFWVMQTIQAILVNTVIFSFIKKYTSHIFFAVLLYYVFLYLNFMCEVMRESCAVSMFLIGYKYFVKEKWLKYYLMCTAAFLFHSSAILLFLIPFLKWFHLTELMHFNKYTVLILIVILVGGFYIQQYLFDYLNLLAFTGRIEDRIDRYNGSSLSGQALNFNGILSSVFFYILYPFLSIVYLKRLYKKKSLSIEPMVFLCFTFVLLKIPIGIFYRYINYFMPFAIIVLSEIIYENKLYLFKKRYVRLSGFKPWIIIFIPLITFRLFEYNLQVGNTHLKEYMRYYPYYSIFNSEIDKSREQIFKYYNAY